MKEFSKGERGPGRRGYLESTTKELDKKGLEKDARIQDFLDKVDFDTTREIYEEIYRRSGGRPQEMNFVPPARFYLGERDRAPASYWPDKNIITINKRPDGSLPIFERAPAFFQPIPGSEYWAAPDIDDAAFTKIDAIFKVLHEEAHAVSANSIETICGFFTDRFRASTGFRTIEVDRGVFHTKSRLLGEIVNEGVTQLLALQALSEYYRRKGSDELGVTSRDVQKYISCFGNDLFNIGFSRKAEVEFVRAFVEYLASIAEVPRDVVWQGIMRGYMCGGNLFDEHISKAFEEKGMEQIFKSLESFDATLSNGEFEGDDPSQGKNVRSDAIRVANEKIFESLPQESQEHLFEIFDDHSGIKVKKVGGNWMTPEQAREEQDFIAQAKELTEREESFPFPGIEPEARTEMIATDREFPGYTTPVDTLLDRCRGEGIRVMLGKNPGSGNVYIVPAGRSEPYNEDMFIFPRHLQINEMMDGDLRALIARDRIRYQNIRR